MKQFLQRRGPFLIGLAVWIISMACMPYLRYLFGKQVPAVLTFGAALIFALSNVYVGGSITWYAANRSLFTRNNNNRYILIYVACFIIWVTIYISVENIFNIPSISVDSYYFILVHLCLLFITVLFFYSMFVGFWCVAICLGELPFVIRTMHILLPAVLCILFVNMANTVKGAARDPWELLSVGMGLQALLSIIASLYHYRRRRVLAAEGDSSESWDRMPKISHLLVVLTDRPRVNEATFFDYVLDELYHDGKSYRCYADQETKLKLVVSGKQDFNDQMLLIVALRMAWPEEKTFSNQITYQQFSGRSGNGVTIQAWR